MNYCKTVVERYKPRIPEGPVLYMAGMAGAVKRWYVTVRWFYDGRHEATELWFRDAYPNKDHMERQFNRYLLNSYPDKA